MLSENWNGLRRLIKLNLGSADGIAADLTTHRTDTEAHQVFWVKES